MDDIDLEALSEEVNEALANMPADVEQVDAEKLAAMMERAKKLLAMAEGGVTPGEREAFAQKAATIMAKYGIESAMLAADGKVREQVGDWTVTLIGPFVLDKGGLLGNVVAAYGGKVIYTSRDTRHAVLRVYAMGADMERIKVLWPSLLTQMETELQWATGAKPAGVRADVFGRNFINAYANTVRKRLELAEQRARQEAQATRDAGGAAGKSVALVLAGRQDEVARRFKQEHPRARSTTRRLTASADGQLAGVRAGQRADLGHAKVGA